jgi:hypothetical protein
MTLEFRRTGVESSQLTEHVRNIGVFVGTR